MSHLATEQAKAEAGTPVGMYVHVPFCASTCDFCAFYQIQPTAAQVKSFLEGVAREAELVSWPKRINTVFWGGGTPGMLSAGDLARLAEIVRARLGSFPIVGEQKRRQVAALQDAPAKFKDTPERAPAFGVRRPGAAFDPTEPSASEANFEWTVELAPTSVTAERLAVLRDAGVTRISMGAQSFQPALLEGLGRQHTRDRIYRAYDRIRAAGFPSVNLDLMFALPGQTAEEWESDLREAIALQPDHLSTYCLTFEEDTALWVKLSQGRVKLDPEHEARLYQQTWQELAAAGYRQYEVSNFARPGHECLHNLNTWRMHEWIGLGPSAASQYQGRRGANISDLDKWLDHLSRGDRATEDRVTLSAASLAEDALIFGLRMNDGVDLALWQARAPGVPWTAVVELMDRLANDGLLQRVGNVVKLTDRGRLLADAIGVEVMAAFSTDTPVPA